MGTLKGCSQLESVCQRTLGEIEYIYDRGIENLCLFSKEGVSSDKFRLLIGKAIEKVESEKKSSLEKLEGVVEKLKWDAPHVAFYGETNAGKSTLIEAIRLYAGGSSTEAGKEIGDGRSDFSRRIKLYPCNFEGRSFTLVDVPGIEGKEKEVSKEIEKALSISHAIFFVTDKAQPPQGGEKDRAGTLEKMKKHLAAQAHIWAVWNKKIQNVRALKHPLLEEKSDTWRSLHEGENSLDGKMRAVLGERYRECLVLSARPAFLALLDEEAKADLLTEQRKFLTRISREELLDKSGLEQFIDVLRADLPADDQLLAGNIRKIVISFEDSVKNFRKSILNEFLGVGKNMQEFLQEVSSPLEEVVDDINRNTRRVRDGIVDEIVMKVRCEMGAAIEAGLGNKEFKNKLEETLKAVRPYLARLTGEAVGRMVENVKASTKSILKDRAVNMEDGLYASHTDFLEHLDHRIDSEVESGIEWGKLSGALVGAVVATIFSSGWALILGLFGAFLGALNGLRGLFGDKKKNQGKVLNKELDKVRPKLSSKLDAVLGGVVKELANVIHSILRSFSEERDVCLSMSNIIKEMNSDLERVLGDLKKLSVHSVSVG